MPLFVIQLVMRDSVGLLELHQVALPVDLDQLAVEVASLKAIKLLAVVEHNRDVKAVLAKEGAALTGINELATAVFEVFRAARSGATKVKRHSGPHRYSQTIEGFVLGISCLTPTRLSISNFRSYTESPSNPIR